MSQNNLYLQQWRKDNALAIKDYNASYYIANSARIRQRRKERYYQEQRKHIIAAK